jgi:hypothetical protein
VIRIGPANWPAGQGGVNSNRANYIGETAGISKIHWQKRKIFCHRTVDIKCTESGHPCPSSVDLARSQRPHLLLARSIESPRRLRTQGTWRAWNSVPRFIPDRRGDHLGFARFTEPSARWTATLAIFNEPSPPSPSQDNPIYTHHPLDTWVTLRSAQRREHGSERRPRVGIYFRSGNNPSHAC